MIYRIYYALVTKVAKSYRTRDPLYTYTYKYMYIYREISFFYYIFLELMLRLLQNNMIKTSSVKTSGQIYDTVGISVIQVLNESELNHIILKMSRYQLYKYTIENRNSYLNNSRSSYDYHKVIQDLRINLPFNASLEILQFLFVKIQFLK